MGLFSKIKNKFSKIALSFSLLLGAVAGSFWISDQGFAASQEAVSGFDVPNCGLDKTQHTGSSVGYSCSATYNNKTLTVETYGGTTGATTAVTFTNKYPGPATLQFDLKINKDKGSVKIDGSEANPGKHEKRLEAGGTRSVAVYARLYSTKSITITNISLTRLYFNTTFEAPSGGSYKVSNSPITNTVIRRDRQAYTLQATPDDGYVFTQWNVNGQSVSKENPYTYVATQDATVYPVFELITSAQQFKVGNSYYSSLQEAADAASSGSNKNVIVNLKEAVVLAGNYTIPNGVTLVVPYDEAGTVILPGDESLLMHENLPETTLFRSLSLCSGCSITVESGAKIYVGSKIYANAASDTSRPVGPYGKIETKDNSSITLNGGAALYCMGYITGNGLVNALSGSTVYEIFQMTDYKGGGYTKEMVGDKKSPKVFPFNQYYVQNVECTLRIHQGADEKVFGATYTNGLKGIAAQYLKATFSFIGPGGLFVLSSGYCEKKYDPTTDRVRINIHGDGEISNIEINFSGLANVKSKEYVLPISNAYDLILDAGSFTVKTKQDISLIPGASITVGAGSSFVLNNKLFVHDTTTWKTAYSGGAKTIPVVYTPDNGTNSPRKGKDPGNAKLNVLGTLSIGSNGYLYVSSQTEKLVISTNDDGSGTSGKIILTGRSEQGTETSSERQFLSGSHPSLLEYTVSYDSVTVYTSWHESVDQNESMSYDPSSGKWRVLIVVTLTFKTKDGTKAFTQEVTFGELLVFPTAETAKAKLGIHAILFWYNENDASEYHVPGKRVSKSEYKANQTFIAFEGGWTTAGPSGSNETFYDPTGATKPDDAKVSGLYFAPSPDGNSSDIYLFEGGRIKTTYSGVYANDLDNQTYLIENGVVVKNKGLYRTSDGYYYYFGENNYAYKDGTYALNDKLNGFLCAGSYVFGSDGKIKRDDAGPTITGALYVKNAKAYIDGIIVGIGLFKSSDNYIYYAKDDGSIVKNSTCYVSKVNDVKDASNNSIKAGLYWFDTEGHFCDSLMRPIYKGA